MYFFLIILLLVALICSVFFHFRKKKIICKIQCMDKCQKCCKVEELVKLFGYCFHEECGFFSSTLDAWQREAGYAWIYDYMAPRFQMVFDALPVYFDYEGKTWLIEFWKGQYGINAGAEIGIPRDYFGEGLDGEVKDAVLAAAKQLAAKGAVVEEFDLSLVAYAIPAYYTIAAAEASSNLERFDGIKYGYRAASFEGLHDMYKKTRSEGFGAEVKRRIMLGSFVLSSGYYDAYYLKALKVKAMIKNAFDDAFAKYDLILGPVAPTTAPKQGESLSDPLKMYLGDIYTISVNLAGLPAISLPCGKDSKGLPIGLQLIADSFQEKKLIQAAYTYEKQ